MISCDLPERLTKQMKEELTSSLKFSDLSSRKMTLQVMGLMDNGREGFSAAETL